MHRVLHQLQAPVAIHGVGDVDQQRVRHRVAAVANQRVDDLLGIVTGRPRVPQPQRRQPVGVDVLGRALEFGERRDRRARLAASGWSTSSSSVLSDWTISGPSVMQLDSPRYEWN